VIGRVTVQRFLSSANSGQRPRLIFLECHARNT